MKNIEQLYKEWQSMQPLSDKNQKRLNDKFMLEFNYNSNHIEGNTLTYGQTKMLLFFGETIGDAKMRDLEEMKAHSAGLKWVEMVAKESEYQLTEIDIRNLNHMIQAEDYYKTDKNGNRYKIHVGVYKTRPNSVITATGEEFTYASPEETSAMMFELVRWFNEEVVKGELSPIELASLLHYRYIRIHPFEDGNGRIARLLINYVMLRYGYPMIIIKSAQKSDYLSALRKADINTGFTPSDGASASLEQIAPFVEYMEQQLAWSLDVAIRAAKGENIDEDEDWKKELSLEMRAYEGRPKVSVEIAKELYSNTLTPYLSEIEKEVKTFDPLFSQINFQRYPLSAESINSDVGQYLYSFHLRKEVYRIDFDVYCRFDKYKYRLHISYHLPSITEEYGSVIYDIQGEYQTIELYHFENFYNEGIPQKQFKNAMNAIGKEILSFYKKHNNE
ncbi:MAG: Fic family protein [Rikenellaceae bacterium]